MEASVEHLLFTALLHRLQVRVTCSFLDNSYTPLVHGTPRCRRREIKITPGDRSTCTRGFGKR